jgi:hypothetical protein
MATISLRSRHRRPGLAAIAAAVALAALLAACGSSGGSAAANAAAAAKKAQAAIKNLESGSGSSSVPDLGGALGGGTNNPGEVGTYAVKPSKQKMRFFNDLVDGTNPGPTLDIYDNLNSNSTGATKLPKGVKPIIKGLRYGQFSDYVIPGEVHIGADSEMALSALISGEPVGPKNQPTSFGTNDAPQQTVVLSAPDTGLANGLGGSNSLTYGSLDEKTGGTNGDSPPSTAPSGQAVFALDTATIPKADNGGGTYFFIDDSCTPPINGDGNKDAPDIFSSGAMADQDGPFPFFPTTPGSHGLAITFWAPNTDATCDDVKPTAPQSTVNVDAGTVYMTIPYGVDAQHIQIAVGAIAQ